MEPHRVLHTKQFHFSVLIPFTTTVLQLTLALDDCNKLQAHLFYQHYFVVTLCVCSVSLRFSDLRVVHTVFVFIQNVSTNFITKRLTNSFCIPAACLFFSLCVSNQISISVLAGCSHAFISCIFIICNLLHPKHTLYSEEALSEHTTAS